MVVATTSWTYTIWAFEFLIYPPFCFVTIAVVANLILSMARQRPLSHECWKKTFWIAVLQFLFFPAAIIVGAVGRVDWQQPHFPGPNHFGLVIEDCLLAGFSILGIYWIWKMAGVRWHAISVTLLQLWLLAGAQFIAAMSLTGTWL
jgi:hypothetical protein